MDTKTNIFEDAPIPKAVASMAIPSMITMLVMVIYNMADTFFIGQTGDAMMVAAVSLAFPIFSIFMGLSSLFGVGGSSAISRALGEGHKERAKNISAFCIYGAIGVSIIFLIIVFIFMRPILNLIGATEATYDYAKSYLTYISLGVPFIVMAGTCANVLRGEGAATASMTGNMIGTVTNIILDPVFILVFGWNVAGAAIATSLGNALACVYYIIYFVKSKTELSINPKDIRAKGHIASNVLSVGFPSSLNQLLMSFATVIMNVTITQYGEIPLAAMNVALKVNMLVVFMQMGLCMGVQPLLGYSYGSGNKKRLKDVFKFTACTTVIIGTVLTVIMVIARSSLVGMFINDPEVIEYGTRMVIALQTAGPVVGLVFLCTSCLQGMGKAVPSMILTISRQGFVYIPAIFIMDRLFGLDGLIWAQPVSDYIAVALGLILCLTAIRSFKPSKRFADAEEKAKTEKEQKKQQITETRKTNHHHQKYAHASV